MDELGKAAPRLHVVFIAEGVNNSGISGNVVKSGGGKIGREGGFGRICVRHAERVKKFVDVELNREGDGAGCVVDGRVDAKKAGEG